MNTDTEQTPVSARKQLVPISRVKKEIEQCRAFLSEISAVLDDAEKAGIKTIAIDGAMKLQRAIELVETFSDKVLYSWRIAKREASTGDVGEE